MLISQRAGGGRRMRQGSRGVNLAELRRQLAEPSAMDGGYRQLLMDLARRLARVQALGDEYARVDFSGYASAVLEGNATVV